MVNFNTFEKVKQMNKPSLPGAKATSSLGPNAKIVENHSLAGGTIKKADFSFLNNLNSAMIEDLSFKIEDLSKKASAFDAVINKIPVISRSGPMTKANPIYRNLGSVAGGVAGYNQAHEEGKGALPTVGTALLGAGVGRFLGNQVGSTLKRTSSAHKGAEYVKNLESNYTAAQKMQKDLTSNNHGQYIIDTQKNLFGQKGSNPLQTAGNYIKGGFAHGVDFINKQRENPISGNRLAERYYGKSYQNLQDNLQPVLDANKKYLDTQKPVMDRILSARERGLSPEEFAAHAYRTEGSPDQLFRTWDSGKSRYQRSIARTQIRDNNYKL